MIPDLFHNLQKPGLFEKFRLQTQRDFELAGAAEYQPKIASNNLPELSAVFLESIIKLETGNALKNLLYRIDITELQIKKATMKEPHLNLQEILAELMIKRILQKVILKELYSDKP